MPLKANRRGAYTTNNTTKMKFTPIHIVNGTPMKIDPRNRSIIIQKFKGIIVKKQARKFHIWDNTSQNQYGMIKIAFKTGLNGAKITLKG